MPAMIPFDEFLEKQLKEGSPEFRKAYQKEVERLQSLVALKGDGKAEFLGEGTHEEYEDLIKEESGIKPWYDIFNRKHD